MRGSAARAAGAARRACRASQLLRAPQGDHLGIIRFGLVRVDRPAAPEIPDKIVRGRTGELARRSDEASACPQRLRLLAQLRRDDKHLKALREIVEWEKPHADAHSRPR